MAFQRTFRRSGDHHADLDALDGVEMKIGESFKPPRKVTLPVGWHQKDPSEVLSLTYDFSMEKKIIQKIETEKLEKQRKQDEERVKTLEKEKANSVENEKEEQVNTSLKNPTTSANSIFSNVGTEILMPTAATNSGHKRNESFGKNAIDFSDFEGTATSPFELVELQTINDMDELKNCFQPTPTTTSITSNVVESDANSSCVSSMGLTNVTSLVATTTSSIENSSDKLSVHSAVGRTENSLISSAITTTGSSQRNVDLTNSGAEQLLGYPRMLVNSTENSNANSKLSKSIPDVNISALIDVNNMTSTDYSRQTQFPKTSGLPSQTLHQPTYLGVAYGIPRQTMSTNSTPHVSSPLYTNVTVSSNSAVGNPTNVPLSPPFGPPQRPSRISIGYTSYNMRDTSRSYNASSSPVNTSSESQTELPAVSSNLYTVPINPVTSINANTSYNTDFQIAQLSRNTKLPPLDNVTSTGPQAPPVPLRNYQTTTTPSDLERSSGLLSRPSIGPTSSGHQPAPPQGVMAPVSSFSRKTSSPMNTRPEYSTGDQNARMLKRHSSPLPPIGLQDTNNDDKETNSYQSALPDPQPLLSETDKKFVSNVSCMGFPAPRVARAVQKFGKNEREIFDFLFVVEELCKTGYTGDESEVALCLNDMKKTKALEFLKLVKTFKELGFKEENIHEALAAADNDSEKALDYLTTGV